MSHSQISQARATLRECSLARLTNPESLKHLSPSLGADATLERLTNAGEEWVVRRNAAFALAGRNVPSPHARAVLREALSDPDHAVRLAAAAAFERLGAADDADVDALLARLSDSSEAVACSAAKALRRVGRGMPRVIQRLSAALPHARPDLAANIVGALGEVADGAPDVLGILIAASGAKDPVVRVEAVEALGRGGAGNAETHAALIRALHDGDPYVRRAAAEALGGVKGEGKVTRALLGTLNSDRENRVRADAAAALGRRGDASRAVITGLCRALEDPDEWVQRSAVEALGWLGTLDKTVETVLTRALDNPHDIVRREAARALGRIGTARPAAVRALTSHMQDDAESAVRLAAVAALEHVGGKDRCVIEALVQKYLLLDRPAGTPAMGAVKHLPVQVAEWERAAVAEALLQFGRPAVNCLAEVLNREASDVSCRRSVIRLLGSFGRAAEPAVPALAAQLGQPDPVGCEAANLLTRLGRFAVPVLIDCLATSNQDIRNWAIFALGRIRRAAVPAAEALQRTKALRPDLVVGLIDKALNRIKEDNDILRIANNDYLSYTLDGNDEEGGMDEEGAHLPPLRTDQEKLLDRLAKTIPETGSYEQMLDAAIALDRGWHQRLGECLQPVVAYLRSHAPREEKPEIELRDDDERARDLRRRRIEFFDPIRSRLNALGFALEVHDSETRGTASSSPAAASRVQIQPMTFHDLAVRRPYRKMVERLKAVNHRFRGQVIARMEAVINEYLQKNDPHQNEAIADDGERRKDLAQRKRELAEEAQSDLKEMRIAIICPLTHRESKLMSSSGQKHPRGRFQIVPSSYGGASVERASVTDLLPLALAEPEPREEGRGGWDRTRGSSPSIRSK
jgi:HEAT repeat protein